MECAMTTHNSGVPSAPTAEKPLLLMCRSVRVRRTRTIRAMASTMETIPGCRSLEESPIPHGQITPTALGVTPLGRFASWTSTLPPFPWIEALADVRDQGTASVVGVIADQTKAVVRC